MVLVAKSHRREVFFPTSVSVKHPRYPFLLFPLLHAHSI